MAPLALVRRHDRAPRSCSARRSGAGSGPTSTPSSEVVQG